MIDTSEYGDTWATVRPGTSGAIGSPVPYGTYQIVTYPGNKLPGYDHSVPPDRPLSIYSPRAQHFLVLNRSARSSHDGGKEMLDRKSTRLNSSHTVISYAVLCLKKNKIRRRAVT